MQQHNPPATRTHRLKVSALWSAIGVLAATTSLADSSAAHRAIDRAPFGGDGNEAVELYTLTIAHGIQVQVMTYGAALVSIKTPDRAARFANIILGFDTLQPYLAGVPFFGATVGRYANRIANARFALKGKQYDLSRNDGPNSLHGGSRGFDKRIWKAEPAPGTSGAALRLTYVSAAGEEGYPGELTAHVSYRLSDDDRLVIEYSATTTAPK